MPGDPVGGSRNPPPSGNTTARDIVKNLFEGDSGKEMTQQQALQQMQERARNEEALRRSSTDSQERGEALDKTRREGSEGAERAATRPETAAPPLDRSADSFLQRSSQLQQVRDAMLDPNLRHTMGSMNAQAWTVAGSPNTPEAARNLLAQRQTTTAHPNSSTTTHAETGASRTPLATLLTRPLAANLGRGAELPASTLLIRYASAMSSGGETSARAFAGRNFGSENLARQLGRMLSEAQAQHPGATGAEIPHVAVQIRGPLIFVRDGDKLRAFRLNDDGSLSELPSDDAGDQPLSPEAQALLRKVLRQRGPQTKMDGGGADSLGELSPEELAEIEGQEAELQEASAGEGELDFETRFALLLHAVLEEDQTIGKKLKAGEDPAFPVKGDWESFFANLLGLGNQEKAHKKTLDDIMGMIFRGLFQKKGAGNTLVGDLKYLADGKTKEDKFAQIEVLDTKLLQLLAELKPGQKISKELLQKYFGDELSYLQMAHVSERLYNMASSAEKNVVFNPKLSYDAFSQARLERQLFATRQNHKSAPPLDTDAFGGQAQPDFGKNGFFANVYEQMGMRERYKGKPRLYTFIAYSVVAAALALITLFILKSLNS